MATNERWLVCGGRNVTLGGVTDILDALESIASDVGFPSALMHGGADGTDSIAGMWADNVGIPCQVFHADWKTHGRAAGPIRNSRMLAEGKPTHVIAFPGGRGTADMVAKATRAGIPAIDGLTGKVLK